MPKFRMVETHDNKQHEKVQSQTPAAGTLLRAGTKVNFSYHVYKEPYKPPGYPLVWPDISGTWVANLGPDWVYNVDQNRYQRITFLLFLLLYGKYLRIRFGIFDIGYGEKSAYVLSYDL